MAREINGLALGSILAGGTFIYAALKGISVLSAVRSVVSGQSPVNLSNVNPIGGGSAATSGTAADTPSGSGVTALKNAAKIYGWDTGNEWQALNNIEMHEAGYSSTVKNSTSGALGIAQALGHGTSTTGGTLGNEYGGFGLTNAQAQAANSGNAGAQALWMVNYIKSRYGTPSAAWAQYVHPDGTSWY